MEKKVCSKCKRVDMCPTKYAKLYRFKVNPPCYIDRSATALSIYYDMQGNKLKSGDFGGIIDDSKYLNIKKQKKIKKKINKEVLPILNTEVFKLSIENKWKELWKNE